jgi:hypothetical protein
MRHGKSRSRRIGRDIVYSSRFIMIEPRKASPNLRYFIPLKALHSSDFTLSAKKLADHYYGSSSVSDSQFDQVQRLMQIALLIEDNIDEIQRRCRKDTNLQRDLYAELTRVTESLESVGDRFRAQSVSLRDKRSRLSANRE